ncbi:MAG: ATPase, partial [Bacteroidales bacterium]
ACILGTGSNSCFYDGNNVVKNVKAGGFILGDEASGGVLGRKLISDYIKGLLPKEIEMEFNKRYQLDYMKVVEMVYKQSMPNRFLASFSPFISEFREHPHIDKMLRGSFDEFFKRNILQYDYKKYDVNFVGSIAYYYQNILKDVAAYNDIRIGKIIKSPIDGLVEYHKELI